MQILIDIPSQTLSLLGDDGACIRRYSVSTARNGAGEASGSFCTPRGRHIIRARIGAGAPIGAAFRGRRPTGEVWTPELAAANPGRDWILTRILWLCGAEPGFNQGELPDGTLVSPPLEDLAPFLPREELEKQMFIPLMPEV